MTIADAEKYTLDVEVNGENSTRQGEIFNNCIYQENLTLDQLPFPYNTNPDLDIWAVREYGVFKEPKLEGPLFQVAQVPVPWLEPGESVDIPVGLKQVQSQLWDSYCENYTHLKYLYYRGIAHMKATETCASSGSSVSIVPCLNGGQDTWDFANPEVPGRPIQSINP